MHRYDELEKLYYKNKIKKYAIIFILFIIAFFTGLFLYKTYLMSNKKTQETKKIDVNFKKIINQKTIIKTDKIIENEKKSRVKVEIKNKDNNQNSTKTFLSKNISAEKTSNKKKAIPNLSFVIPEIKDFNKTKDETKHTKAPVKNKEKPKKEEVKNKKTVPEIKEEQINIIELIKSFNKRPSYDTAMVVSRYYFKNNDLKNAKLWALKANNIDPSKYESWKMFALILLKKNDKIKAKEILKIYLNDYGDNDEIYKLLRSIDE